MPSMIRVLKGPKRVSWDTVAVRLYLLLSGDIGIFFFSNKRPRGREAVSVFIDP